MARLARPAASWALCLGALLLAALGDVGEALEPPQGLLGPRTPLLPALRDAAALLSQAEADGGRGAAAVLKAQDALWPALGASLRPLLLGAGAGEASAAARRLTEADGAPTPLEALRDAALQARTHNSLAQLRAARQAASGLAGQLSGPLGLLLASASDDADGSSGTHRRLSEGELLPQQLQERAADLAARFHQLGAARSGLLGRLREALSPGSDAAPARRLRQEEQAKAGAQAAGAEAGSFDGSAEEEWWWAEEKGEYGAAGYPGYPEGGLPDILIIEDVSLVPLASNMLNRMLALARDALNMAITLSPPSSAGWPAAYSSSLPQLLDPLPYEASTDLYASEEEQPSADTLEGQPEMLGDMQAVPAGGAATAGQQPPLPQGEPPTRRRRLRQSDSYDDPSYYDESYDDGMDDYSGSEYSEEAYYADLDDWLFDSALELQIVLTRLTSPPATAAGGTQAPSADASQPALPVFAVFAGSSKAAVPPGNGSAAPADSQPTKPQAVELLIAPFSEAARTPVPHTEGRTGLDPKYLGAAISVSCLVLLLGLLAGAWHWARSRTRGPDGDQQESLLYQHIPGTPSRARGGAAGAAATPWAAGKAGGALAAAASGAVPKKLSNLPA
ncbi:hypothetical protein ABPG75_001319 [Micractinium tetrahymenae]